MIMITFRTEQTVGDIVTMTEVDVVYHDDDSASAIAANNKMVNTFCELLLPNEAAKIESGTLSQTNNFVESIQIKRPNPPGKK